jgi:hypothetical protein
MHKFKKLKPRFIILVSDRPLALTPVDAKIACNNKTLIVIKATSENMQAFKTNYTLSLFKIINQRIKENG